MTKQANIGSYVGVPVFYQNGEMFGTLCAIDSAPSHFTEKDIHILERFSNLFSYVIELEKQVQLDSLTELYSRRYLVDRMENVDKGMVMLIDLDGFKEVNDTYGHDVGDLVLIEVGHRLKSLSSSKLVFRLGGDEFIILFPGEQDDFLMRENARLILNSLSTWDNFSHAVSISASIGIVKMEHPTKLNDMLKKVDNAMYRAKGKGKNCLHFDSM
ncbi:sensor domain-containing diguanylate cyclase [Aquibacillus sp. 3ASR75-54]|uniref:Sensor domain-containing diguanylate cyclase n=1 Tax=Aquibacillus salsiterrae TaxID=2950439 RepID=A0A9X4AHI4_9BACI|nr:sensor domain-containing diguanylate cyclase [Aquibacillus salsiterrae]